MDFVALHASTDCDVVIADDKSVSRRHAVIRVNGSVEVSANVCKLWTLLIKQIC